MMTILIIDSPLFAVERLAEYEVLVEAGPHAGAVVVLVLIYHAWSYLDEEIYD